MAYSKPLLKKGIKRRDPRMARKGAQNKAVKAAGPGSDFNMALKWHRDH
jgi:hypothetical protein